MIGAFQKSGTFRKGNLHGHSTNSDGKLTPEQVVEAYHKNGYDFTSITDHFIPEASYASRPDWTRAVTDASHLTNGDFTTIVGAEIHAPSLVNGEIWHLVAVGIPADFEGIGAEESGLDIARRAHETGAFVGIAHPAWYTLTVQETLPLLPYAHSIEIYNTACNSGGRSNAWYFADEVLTLGHKLHAYAADDSHHINPVGSYCDAFGGWVNVKTESMDASALVEAIKAGDYYSSTGPELMDVQWDGEKLTVQSSTVDRYYISGKGARVRSVYGGNLTECEVELRPETREAMNWGDYLRVTAIDANGKAAWTQPLWLTDGD